MDTTHAADAIFDGIPSSIPDTDTNAADTFRRWVLACVATLLAGNHLTDWVRLADMVRPPNGRCERCADRKHIVFVKSFAFVRCHEPMWKQEVAAALKEAGESASRLKEWAHPDAIEWGCTLCNIEDPDNGDSRERHCYKDGGDTCCTPADYAAIATC